MTYIIMGVFSLIISLNQWSYTQANSFNNMWDELGNTSQLGNTDISINGTLQIGNSQWMNVKIMRRSQLEIGGTNDESVEIIAVAPNETDEIQLMIYELHHDERTVTNIFVLPDVTINFSRTEVNETEYNILMTMFQQQSGTGVSTIYNQGYNQGYQDGLDVGGMNANDQYTAGYNIGKMDGYNKGYDEAMKIADNPYTFRNLLFAVIESPAVFIKSWLNTEVLGINVAGLIFGIFTIAVIIGVGALIKHFI